MTLLLIAAALACERLLSHLRRWREYDWVSRYLARLLDISLFEPLWKSPWGLLFLLPPLLFVGLLQALLQGGVLTLVGLVFAVLVLVFSLGPRDLWEEVHALINARRAGDEQQAAELARDLCAVAGRRPRQARGGMLVRAVLVQGCERVFGVLLWFFVLGPVGAVLYRMAAELPRQLRVLGVGGELLDAALRLHGVLAWAPVRITALLYGLSGSTDGALAGWRSARAAGADNWVQYCWQLLAQTGNGALSIEEGTDHSRIELGLEDTLREALGLVTRSLIILLAVLAAFTIGGWIV